MSAAQREWTRTYAIDNIQIITQYGAGWVDPVRSTGAVALTRDRHLDQADWIAEDPENRTADDWRRFKNELAPVMMNGTFEDFSEFHELIATAMGIPSANVSLVVHELIIPVDTEVRVWDIPTILMVLVLLLLLAMLLYGLLRRQKSADDEEESLEPQLAVEDLLVSTQLEEAKEEEAAQLEEIDYFKENEIKKHIDKFVNEKPEAVASLLRNWINVEEW
jgi:flagellar M-ring protein FliF